MAVHTLLHFTVKTSPAVAQYSLGDVLRARVSKHRPLCRPTAVRIEDILWPLPLVDPPSCHRLFDVFEEGDVGGWKVRISERLFTLREIKK